MFIVQTKKINCLNENISQCHFHVHFLAAGFPVIFSSYKYYLFVFKEYGGVLPLVMATGGELCEC